MIRKKQKRRMGSKLFSGFLAALMVVTIMTANGISSGAANTADTFWSFNVSTNNSSYVKSDVRPKYDKSAFYIQWQATNGPSQIYVQTYGGLSGTASGMQPYNYKDSIALLPRTGRYSVSSTVYEKLSGYGTTVYACFGVKAATGSGYIAGYWSPDSAGSYNNPIR